MSNKIDRRSFIKSSLIAGVAFGGGYLTQRSFFAKDRFDLVIKNGVIYDGVTKLPVKGDIGIKDGVIKAIGDLEGSSAAILDANGMVVAPGFVDIHTHTDTNLLYAPLGDSRIYQGVTTDIGGNCGDSPFPGKSYESISDLMAKIEAVKPGINYGTFVGMGQLRSFVMGDNNIPASAEHMQEMISILSRELERGAVGISLGLEYVPGSYASEDEITELCKVVKSYDRLLAVHMRNEDDYVERALEEAIRIAKRSGVRIQISHLKAQNAANWHKAPVLLDMIERASSDGVDIAFDRYPYTAFSTGLSSFVPLDLRQGSAQEVVGRLENRESSTVIEKYALSRIERLGGAQNVVITSCTKDENRRFIGKNVQECALLTNQSPWQFIRGLLIDEQLSVSIIGFAMKEENLKMLLSHRLGMPASDGSVYSPVGELSKSMPHPRSYGTFPRFIGGYCRDEKWMDLGEAIIKCTSLPASRVGLKGVGAIKTGYNADIVIFDPQKISDVATYSNPHQFASGIEHVIVNGVHTIVDGGDCGKRGGKTIRL